MTSQQTPFDRTFTEVRGEGSVDPDEYRHFKEWFQGEIRRGRPQHLVLADVREMLNKRDAAARNDGW